MMNTEDNLNIFDMSNVAELNNHQFHIKEENDTKLSDKQYQCNQCEITFELEVDLTKHLRTHTEEKQYKCSHCTRSFSYIGHFKRHVATSCGNYWCDQCCKTFKNRSSLTNHLRTHSEDRDTLYKCDHCDKYYFGEDAHKLHQEQETHCGNILYVYQGKQYDNTLAKRTCLVEPNLTYTEDNISHSTICDKYRCIKCSKSFANESKFTEHNNIHTGETPYLCCQCGKGFSQKGKFNRHMRVHNRDRPYKCNECDKVFIGKPNLTSHHRTHTGEKPCKCNKCDKAFAHKHNVLIHNRNHHKE